MQSNKHCSSHPTGLKLICAPSFYLGMIFSNLLNFSKFFLLEVEDGVL